MHWSFTESQVWVLDITGWVHQPTQLDGIALGVFPQNIYVMMQNGDFPRSGDYPEKLDLFYVSNLMKNGSWFSGKEQMIST